MKIKIPDKMVDYLEGLHYECNARADLVAFLIRSGLKETDGFDSYHNEYLKFHPEYELAKKELETLYIQPACQPPYKWDLDFGTKEVTIIAS